MQNKGPQRLFMPFSGNIWLALYGINWKTEGALENFFFYESQNGKTHLWLINKAENILTNRPVLLQQHFAKE